MLIEACAELMVKKGCTMSLDDVKALTKVAYACIMAFAKKSKARKARKAEVAYYRFDLWKIASNSFTSC